MKTLLSWVRAHREIAAYVFFGGLTTLVNIVCYYALSRLLGSFMGRTQALNAANLTAILLAILFAYITNRRYVFRSKAVGRRAVLAEMTAFFGCRFFTLLLDMGLMNLLAVFWRWPDMISKVLVNLVVIVANYILSKRIVFRKGGNQNESIDDQRKSA